MIRINKGQEPNEWLQYRLTSGVEYAAIPELRKALLIEQGYICGYCMKRISDNGRIEHIKCRERYPEHKLDYNNMIICCSGETGADFHCDRKKENRDISFTPFDTNFIDTVSYATKSGKIKSSNTNWNDELNNVLNLNFKILQNNRKQVIDAICLYLNKKGWTNTQLISQLLKWQSFDNEHKLKEYCGVVIWFLQKKLKT